MQRENIKILYVDDEDSWRVVFQRHMSGVFDVITARNAEEGWDLLNKHAREIAVVISDQRMPGRPGIELLKQARAYYPKIVRMITTGFSDSNIAVHATNLGSVYHYISKPWNGDELVAIVKRAVDFYLLRWERDNLLERKLSAILRKNLESKLQCLLVFGISRRDSVHRSMHAFAAYLDSIGSDPGQVTHFRSVFKQAQSELDSLLLNLGVVESLNGLPEELGRVREDNSVDVRKVLLATRDACNQVIYSVRNVASGRSEDRTGAEQLLVRLLLELINHWVGEKRDEKLLEISERSADAGVDPSGVSTFHLRICDYRDPDPLPLCPEDPVFNGINLDESRELGWLKFLLAVHHLGGSVRPRHLSMERLQFEIGEFQSERSSTLAPSALVANLIRKFEAWNYGSCEDESTPQEL